MSAVAIPGRPPLAAAEIHLWFCEISAEPRAARAAAQAVLHALLAGYRGRPLDAGDLVVGAHGKPALADATLQFNLSHAQGAVLVALARDQAVGVDLERPGRARPHLALAQRYFCASETALIAAAEPAQREALFLTFWTAKEALLKALGRGIAFGLDRLEFDPQTQPPTLRRIAAEAGAAADWRLHVPAVPAPWRGCLAWRGAACSVRLFQASAVAPA